MVSLLADAVSVWQLLIGQHHQAQFKALTFLSSLPHSSTLLSYSSNSASSGPENEWNVNAS